MKSLVILCGVVFNLFCFAGVTHAEQNEMIPVCGAIVASRFVHEVKDPTKPDKYSHCSISCVMTIYCGPSDSLEVGALKEIYDAMGFGDPDIKDLEADYAGVKAGLKIGFGGRRSSCYKACGSLFP